MFSVVANCHMDSDFTVIMLDKAVADSDDAFGPYTVPAFFK